MAKRFEGFYKVERNANLGDPEFWNKRLQDIDLRIAARELDGGKIDEAVATITSVALGRLNDTFTPVVNEAIERLASVGALFSSTSDSETNIGLGNKTFVLDAETRDGFVVPEYVSIRPGGLTDRGMIAQVTNYDRATGLLDVAVVLFTGSGTYADWQVRITGAPDLDHSTRTDNPHETTAAQVGAYTVAQANTAISTAVSSGIATEVTARNSAITSAINALKGGVSTAYDTLIEFAAKLADDDTIIGGLLTSVGNRLRLDILGGYTSSQMAIGRANLGIQLRNYEHNGAMMVSQEYGQAAIGNTSSGYVVDDYQCFNNTGATFTAQQVQSQTPGGSPFRVRITMTSTPALTTGQAFLFRKKFEGVQIADLGFGTAAAKQVVRRMGLRFPAGSWGVSIYNDATDRAYIAQVIISPGEANIDVVKTVTFRADTSGTWLRGVGIGCYMDVCLGCAADIQRAAGGWAAPAGKYYATGQTNGIVSGNVFELFDFGLYEGDAPPPFIVPEFAVAEKICQRYWAKTEVYFRGDSAYGNTWTCTMYFPQPMRAAPGVVGIAGGTTLGLVSIGLSDTSPTSCALHMAPNPAPVAFYAFLKYALNARL